MTKVLTSSIQRKGIASITALKTSRCLLASVVAASMLTSSAFAAELLSSKARETAPTVGWASQNGSTTGGASAASDYIYVVTNISEFKTALNAGSTPKIIQIKGKIDVSGGTAYTSFTDQQTRSQLSIPSNTTIFGIGTDAKLTNGSLIIKDVTNVIVRNVYIETPVDVAPHYEDGDGWNAEWDGMNINNAQHVWVDHVTISDGSFTDDMYTTKDGETYVQHDGALDIKRGADYVTVSNSRFEQHDKTMLIGHSDTNSAQDAGKLHVTLYNNLFSNVRERAPRVRFGNIHSFNNVYQGDVKHSVYPYLYSFGIGTKGSLLSEKNSFEVSNLKKNCKIVKKFNNGNFSDSGSLLNGSSVDLSDCGLTTYSDTIPYTYTAQTMTTALSQSIVNNAGSGKL
ncbi:pectate lyase family protein [Musicola paradisiaca]|uniref:Pectate lyase/Amb allergen n=1 Tax=Musicola paradisiaca (strain Ech703) TaxID=579405 RepID=C6CAP2_MUSP7|nr:polysaccharide lyase [Musicola paradisiaca]ACS86540.1 Pectate lyase/Amb allergen [Musicola paradisiaca Ech703]